MPPPGMPSSNGKFVVLAVLLVGLIGAVIAWKSLQKPPQPIVIAAPDAGFTAPPKPNIDDDIPPPPVVEDSGVDPDAGKKVTPIVLGSACDPKAKCTGSTNADVEGALQFRAKQAHRCYDNALAQDPTLRGKISIAVRIGPNGQACSAAVVNNELASAPSVASCVAGNFRGQNFPAPRGGCVDVNIPINFVPRQ